MNLTRFRNTSDVLCQLLCLYLINIDIILCCLSMDYKTKDVKMPEINPADETIELWKEPPEELSKIRLFTIYMSQYKQYNLNVSDWEFFWDQLKEFTRELKKKEVPPVQPVSSGPRLTIQDIDEYLNKSNEDNILIGVMNIDKTSKVVSKDQAKYFKRQEFDYALRATKLFHDGACNLTNVTFCVQDYLNAVNKKDDIHQILPPGFWLRRCPKRCSCLQENEQCLPTSIKPRKEYSFSINVNSEKSTWLLYLFDHTGCQCKDKCENRRCIRHFTLKTIRKGECRCECVKGNEKECSQIYNGRRRFRYSDYQCIVNGTCITPQCRAGHLSEESLSRLTCPEVLY